MEILKKWRNLFPIPITKQIYLTIQVLFIIIFILVTFHEFQMYQREIANEKQHLFTVAKILDLQLTGSFEDILRKAQVLNQSKTKKIAVLNGVLQPKINQLLTVFPQTGMGFYSQELRYLAAYGPGDMRLNLKELMPKTPSLDQTRKDEYIQMRSFVWNKQPVLALDYPINRNGKMIGHIFVNVKLTSLYLIILRNTAAIFLISFFFFIFLYYIASLIFRRFQKAMKQFAKVVTEDEITLDSNIKNTIPELNPILDLVLKYTNELKKSKLQTANILENISDGFFTLDNQWRVTYLNKKALTFQPDKKEVIIGKVFWEVHPRAVGTILDLEFQRATSENVPVHFEANSYYENNWYEVHAYPSPEGLSVFIRDITLRKQTEEAISQLASIVESSEDAIIGFDLDGRIVSWNSGAEKVYGYSEDELKAKTIAILCPPEKHQELIQIDEILRRKENFSLYETERLRKDGKRINVSVRISIIKNALGEVTGVSAIHRDITDKKKMEEELLKTQKLELLGILAGGIAHDFNNILAAILANVQLAMSRSKQGKDIQKYLLETIKATEKATDLTKQLLTFSKGGVPVKKVTSIADLIKDTTTFTLRGTKVLPKFFIQEHLWNAELDEGQISQVINNLIINAQQAMADGGNVDIYANNMVITEKDILPLEAGNYVRITVRDYGMGISNKHLEKMFVPFFTTKKEGNGLGLATAYSIIKRHGGHIDLESVVGVGTTFYILLPAIVDKNTGIDIPNEEVSGGEGKILLMDDEEAILKSVGEMLYYSGFRVSFANDGVEAVKLYKQAKDAGDPFDAIIMDLTIPGGVGGKEAMEVLLKIDPNVKAIVSSGYSNNPVMSNFLEYGFCAVIPKPYKIEDLCDILNQVISKEQLKLSF